MDNIIWENVLVNTQKTNRDEKLTQQTLQCINKVCLARVGSERCGFHPNLTAEKDIKRLVMMKHHAQESRSASVFAEGRPIRIGTEMCRSSRFYQTALQAV